MCGIHFCSLSTWTCWPWKKEKFELWIKEDVVLCKRICCPVLIITWKLVSVVTYFSYWRRRSRATYCILLNPTNTISYERLNDDNEKSRVNAHSAIEDHNTELYEYWIYINLLHFSLWQCVCDILYWISEIHLFSLSHHSLPLITATRAESFGTLSLAIYWKGETKIDTIRKMKKPIVKMKQLLCY